jgi:hypothetical protein
MRPSSPPPAALLAVLLVAVFAVLFADILAVSATADPIPASAGAAPTPISPSSISRPYSHSSFRSLHRLAGPDGACRRPTPKTRVRSLQTPPLGGANMLGPCRRLTFVDAASTVQIRLPDGVFHSNQARNGSKTEGGGFEPPSEASPLKRFSRPPHSTTLPPFHSDLVKARGFAATYAASRSQISTRTPRPTPAEP